ASGSVGMKVMAVLPPQRPWVCAMPSNTWVAVIQYSKPTPGPGMAMVGEALRVSIVCPLLRAQRGCDGSECPPVEVVREARISCRMGRELDDDELGNRVDVHVLPVQSLHLEGTVAVVRDPPLVVVRVARAHGLAVGL